MFGLKIKQMGVVLAGSALLFAQGAAQATMLTGSVEESSIFNGSPLASLNNAPQAKPKSKPTVARRENGGQPSVNLSPRVPAFGRMSAAPQNNEMPLASNPAPTTPSTVQGVWMCTTQVVESSSPSVQPGTVVQCQIKFQALDASRVQAQWAQQGWTPAQAAVGQCGGGMLRITHESANQGFSAARSDDFVQVVNPNVMRSVSVVNQFENGAYAGSYKTQSVLRRI